MVTVAGFSSPALLLLGDAPLAPGDAMWVLVDAALTAGFLATSSSEDREYNLDATVLFCMPETPALNTDCLSTAALCKGDCKQALTHRQQKMMFAEIICLSVTEGVSQAHAGRQSNMPVQKTTLQQTYNQPDGK